MFKKLTVISILAIMALFAVNSPTFADATPSAPLVTKTILSADESRNLLSTSFSSLQDGNWNDFTTWNTNTTTFSQPTGVTLDFLGNIYVVDGGHQRIVVLNPDGTTKAVYTGSDISSLPGSPASGFAGIYGISLDQTGNIYIADSGHNRIVVLNPDGSAKAVYSSANFNFITDVNLDSSGNIYVASYDNNRIVVLNPDGTGKAVYTGGNISSLPGTPTAGFSGPDSVAIDSSNNIYVVDQSHGRIVVLNPNGTAKAVYTGSDISSLPGTPTAGFSGPLGLTVDSSGNIYIGDQNNARVVVLNPDGTAKAVYDGSDISSLPGSPTNNFHFPVDISLDSSGNIYVVDFFDNRIIVLNPDSTAKAVYATVSISSVEDQNYPGPLGDATINNTVTLSADQSVHNLTIASGGTLDLNGHILNVSGNFTNNGTFTANNGTINLTSTNQVITGANTFYNLTKTTSTTDTLYFTGGTQTVTGTLNLSGAKGNLLSLRAPATTVPAFSLKWGSQQTSSTNFSNTGGVALDSSGNIYVSDSGNNRIVKLDPNGTQLNNFIADNLLATPYNIALDSSGNIYVADSGNNRIVKMDSTGAVLTNFTAGDSLNGPQGVALDSSGNIYVADFGNNSIVKLNPTGALLDTFTDDDSLIQPSSVAVDSFGNIYIADSGNDRIVKLSPSGSVLNTFSHETINNLNFNSSRGVTIDSTGNIYVADSGNKRIVKLNSTGAALDIFSTGDSLNGPQGVALDSSGNIYVADFSNQRIIKLSPTGTVLSTFKNTIFPSQFQNLSGITADSQNNVYVMDYASNNIQKFDSSGNFIKMWGSAGTAEGQFSLNYPDSLTVDSHDNVYVADISNNRIQEFDSNGTFIKMWGWGVQDGSNEFQICTSGCQAGMSGGGDGEFNGPSDITVDASGNSFVVENDGNTVEEFDVTGAFVKVFGWGVLDGTDELQVCRSGCQSASYGSGDGQLDGTYGITADSQGNLYLIDSNNNRIDEFTPAGAFVKTWGWGVQDGSSELQVCTGGCQAGVAGSGDGQFNGLYSAGIAIDSSGVVYVNDIYEDDFVQIFTTDGVFKGKIGTGTDGDGNGEFSSSSYDLAIDNEGNIYVPDDSRHDIQKFTPVSGWTINPQGEVNIAYVNVTGSNNLGAKISCSKGCTNGGGNTNWKFPQPTTGGSSGSARVAIINNTPLPPVSPLTPPANIPSDCQSGFAFSPSTGASCSSASPTPNNTNTNITKPNLGLVTLRQGSTGDAVKSLQSFLNSILHLTLVTDGKLGPKTILAIKQYQSTHGLVPDGVVGPKTKASMGA